MCDFCKLHADGYESCRDYISEGIDLGQIENAMVMTIWFNEDENTEGHSLSVDMTTSAGSTIASLSMPIRYCPVCGRDLERGPLFRFFSKNGIVEWTNKEVNEKC